jgi:hypothetical protein
LPVKPVKRVGEWRQRRATGKAWRGASSPALTQNNAGLGMQETRHRNVTQKTADIAPHQLIYSNTLGAVSSRASLGKMNLFFMSCGKGANTDSKKTFVVF